MATKKPFIKFLHKKNKKIIMKCFVCIFVFVIESTFYFTFHQRLLFLFHNIPNLNLQRNFSLMILSFNSRGLITGRIFKNNTLSLYEIQFSTYL